MNKKNKIILGCGAVVLVAAVVTGIIVVRKNIISKNNGNVTIIGGADGPTSVFLAGKLDDTANTVGYLSIPMEEAKEIFATKGDYVILDVRTEEEYAEGHIPGAINVANEEIADKEPEKLADKNQVIYVYCRSGRRSKEAAKKLIDLGYMNIVECGGITSWDGDIEK